MVVEHTHHSLGGESAILYYSAKEKKVYAINGVGTAPKLATREYFDKLGYIPDEDSFLIAPVPGTLDGAVLTLDKFGTLKLSDAMKPAIDLAEKGHPIDHIMVKWITNAKAILSKWPGSVKVFLPGGNPPKAGEIFVQPEYAATLKMIRDGETQNRSKGRSKAMRAARDVFYKGKIARALDKFSQENGGLVRYEDLAGYRAKVEEPWKTNYKGYEVYSCGSWTQGPMMLQVMNLLEPLDMANLKHNSPEYMHVIIEAFKLAYMDRHTSMGILTWSRCRPRVWCRRRMPMSAASSSIKPRPLWMYLPGILGSTKEAPAGRPIWVRSWHAPRRRPTSGSPILILPPWWSSTKTGTCSRPHRATTWGCGGAA